MRHKHLANTYHMHTPTLAVAAGLTTDLKSGLLVSEVEFGANNLRIQPLFIALRPIDGERAVREDNRQRSQRQNVLDAGYADSN